MLLNRFVVNIKSYLLYFYWWVVFTENDLLRSTIFSSRNAFCKWYSLISSFHLPNSFTISNGRSKCIIMLWSDGTWRKRVHDLHISGRPVKSAISLPNMDERYIWLIHLIWWRCFICNYSYLQISAILRWRRLMRLSSREYQWYLIANTCKNITGLS